MPSVINMTLKDALYLLESKDVSVLIKGRGKVVAQTIAPGADIVKNQKITLILN